MWIWDQFYVRLYEAIQSHETKKSQQPTVTVNSMQSFTMTLTKKLYSSHCYTRLQILLLRFTSAMTLILHATLFDTW